MSANADYRCGATVTSLGPEGSNRVLPVTPAYAAGGVAFGPWRQIAVEPPIPVDDASLDLPHLSNLPHPSDLTYRTYRTYRTPRT